MVQGILLSGYPVLYRRRERKPLKSGDAGIISCLKLRIIELNKRKCINCNEIKTIT
jgi:hypothetical protein